MEQAGRGAFTGSAVGAVGGRVTALVFGGNVCEAAGRGAVYGGSTGATVGAISGTVADSNEKKAHQAAELEALRKKRGDDAFQGLAAITISKWRRSQFGLSIGEASLESSGAGFEPSRFWTARMQSSTIR